MKKKSHQQQSASELMRRATLLTYGVKMLKDDGRKLPQTSILIIHRFLRYLGWQTRA